MHRFYTKLSNLSTIIEKLEDRFECAGKEEREELRKEILEIANERIEVSRQMNEFIKYQVNDFNHKLEKDDSLDMFEENNNEKQKFMFKLKKNSASPISSRNKGKEGLVVEKKPVFNICYCKENLGTNLVECSNILVS